MLYWVKHISASGHKTEQMVHASSSCEAVDKVMARLGDAMACVCLSLNRMSAAQRAAWGV